MPREINATVSGWLKEKARTGTLHAWAERLSGRKLERVEVDGDTLRLWNTANVYPVDITELPEKARRGTGKAGT